MPALRFPCTIFKTQKKMNDYQADDMRYGDLSDIELKARFKLVDVSSRADPYTLTKISPFSQPHSRFHGSRDEREMLTTWQCADILFDELRHRARLFAFVPPYDVLIGQMITHLQKGCGLPFRHALLDSALKEHILNDRTENSTLSRIQDVLSENIDWKNNIYPTSEKDKFDESIRGGKLPKFDRFQDNFNGLGITVHDTWATHIHIDSLKIENDRYHAVVRYTVQDHFGLDDDDISKVKFKFFRFFGIWFILQRYSRFKFKPFMTNMEAKITITGGRNDCNK